MPGAVRPARPARCAAPAWLRPSPSPAASMPDREIVEADARQPACRSPGGYRRWSGWFQRWRSTARPCAAPASWAPAPDPVRPAPDRRKARIDRCRRAARRSAADAPGGFRRQPGKTSTNAVAIGIHRLQRRGCDRLGKPVLRRRVEMADIDPGKHGPVAVTISAPPISQASGATVKRRRHCEQT